MLRPIQNLEGLYFLIALTATRSSTTRLFMALEYPSISLDSSSYAFGISFATSPLLYCPLSFITSWTNAIIPSNPGHSSNSCSSSPKVRIAVHVISCSKCLSRLFYYNVPYCSLSEWKQAQCRDGEGCGDPCEQAIATLKQAEEVIKLICMNFM